MSSSRRTGHVLDVVLPVDTRACITYEIAVVQLVHVKHGIHFFFQDLCKISSSWRTGHVLISMLPAGTYAD